MLSIASDMVSAIDKHLEKYSPTLIIVTTLASYWLLKKSISYGYRAQQYARRNWPTPFFDRKQVKKSAVQVLHDVSLFEVMVEKKAEKELRKLGGDLQNSVNRYRKFLGPASKKIPEYGKSREVILGIISQAMAQYESHLKGRVSGMMYYKEDKEYNDLLDWTYSLTKFTNPMHDEEFPIIDRMTAEVLAMSQSLFGGNPSAFNTENRKILPGLVTDGGTSSIMEACSAYVKLAKSRGIEQPEIIIPSSAHVSFKNAAERVGAKLVIVPVDPKTGKADTQAMEWAINRNTCMMAASAPSFPAGVFDDVPELGRIALQKEIPLHVDACLGGFLAPFARLAGYSVPLFDFSALGVMSISADPHKYGQTPKGSSVLLFHPDNPASGSAIFTDLKWAGGMYVAQGMKGSRPGHVVATTWAAMMYHGMNGYTSAADSISSFTKLLAAEIGNVDGIRLIYPPELSVIAITSSDPAINPYLVASQMKKMHWSLNTIQEPRGFHFCITAAHSECQSMILNEFIRDLNIAVRYARVNPNEKPSGTAGVYGMLPEVPDFLENRIGQLYAAIHNTLVPEAFDEAVSNDSEEEHEISRLRRRSNIG